MASRELYMSTRSSGHQTGFQAAWRWKKPAVLWATIGHEFMSQRLVAVIILWSKSGHGAEEERNNFQSFEDETIPLLLRWMGDGNFCAGFFHQDILDMIWHTKRTFRHDFLHSSEHHFVHRRSDGGSPTLFGLRQHHGITSWISEGNFWSPRDVRLSMTRIGRHHQEKRQCCNEFIRIITKWGIISLNKQPPDKTTPSIIRFVSCGRNFCVWQSVHLLSPSLVVFPQQTATFQKQNFKQIIDLRRSQEFWSLGVQKCWGPIQYYGFSPTSAFYLQECMFWDILVLSLIYFIVNYFLVVLVVEPIFATKGTYIQLQKRPQLHPGALRPESLTGSAVLRAYENKPWRGSNTKSAIGPVFKRRYCCGDTFLRDTWHRIVSLDAVLLSICVTELFFWHITAI